MTTSFFVLFSTRAKLKESGDLTPHQRDKLKKLQHDGLRGYYKNGKLIVTENRPEHLSDHHNQQPPGQQQQVHQGQSENVWFGRPRSEHHYAQGYR